MKTKTTVSMLYKTRIHDVEVEPIYGLINNDSEVGIVYYEASLYDSGDAYIIESAKGTSVEDSLYNLIMKLGL